MAGCLPETLDGKCTIVTFGFMGMLMSHEGYECYVSMISGAAQLSALAYGTYAPAVHRLVKAKG